MGSGYSDYLDCHPRKRCERPDCAWCTSTDSHGEPVDDPTMGGMFVDWDSFFKRERVAEEWVVSQLLAKGKGHAIYATGKTGKTELIQATLMSEVIASPISTNVVVYLDYEMSEDDLAQRLIDDFGYGPDTDMSRLYYAQIPRLEPLDTLAGASQLQDMLEWVQERHEGAHLIVIFDTMARAVEGEENSNDTVRNFYRFTGTVLKRLCCTWVRVDHAGHEGSHMRGASAKKDDVDVVWRLERTDNGARVKCEAKRPSWIPEHVDFQRLVEPVVSYARIAESWPLGTEAVAKRLDELGVPLGASRRNATEALRAAGQGAKTLVVSAAMRYRRDFTEEQRTLVEPFLKAGNHSGNHSETVPGTTLGTTPVTTPLTSGNHSGNHREPERQALGTMGSPYKGNHGPSPVPSPGPGGVYETPDDDPNRIWWEGNQ